MTILLWVLAAAVLALLGMVAVSARLIISPGRQPVWTTPKEVGLDYEDIAFPAQDGVRLKGWFVPAAGARERRAATVVMVHGWPWNRIGTRANNPLKDLPGSKPINLLPFVKALHGEGYNVLMFDMRNFGESAADRPITSGWREKRDLLGAIDYALQRPEVDADRLGAIGFSMGGNTVLFALPHTTRLKAAVSVQPNTSAVFSARYAKSKLGPLRFIVSPLVEILYRLSGSPKTDWIEPIYAVAGARDTPVLYVQGSDDPWGSADDVRRMVAATPNAVEPLFPKADHRFGGYQYVIDHPQEVLDFLRQYLSPGLAASQSAVAR